MASVSGVHRFTNIAKNNILLIEIRLKAGNNLPGEYGQRLVLEFCCRAFFFFRLVTRARPPEMEMADYRGSIMLGSSFRALKFTLRILR